MLYRKPRIKDVMLRHSKHGVEGLYIHALRQTQGDSAPLFMLSVLLFVFLSVNVSAQSSDTTHRDTSKKLIIVDAVTPSSKMPLIIVDGEVYKKDLKNIDPKSILSIDVLKGKGAVSVYGPDAANGVVVITTKK